MKRYALPDLVFMCLFGLATGLTVGVLAMSL